MSSQILPAKCDCNNTTASPSLKVGTAGHPELALLDGPMATTFYGKPKAAVLKWMCYWLNCREIVNTIN
jgi:hypothetical protein